MSEPSNPPAGNTRPVIPATIMLYPVVLPQPLGSTAHCFPLRAVAFHPRVRFLWPGGGSIYLEMPRSWQEGHYAAGIDTPFM